MTAKRVKSGLTKEELEKASRMVLCLFKEFGSTIKGSQKHPEKEYKIYELYCAYELLKWMELRYNVDVSLNGGEEVKVRQKGGEIDKDKLYFKVESKDRSVKLEVHMNIHFLTLGSYLSTIKNSKYTQILKYILNLKTKVKNCTRIRKFICTPERCERANHGKTACKACNIEYSFLHEIDIALINECPYHKHPSFSDILLGVECKNHATINKRIIRESLGVRRELSFYSPIGRRSDIDRIFNHKEPEKVNAFPSSLYWLACPDCKILNYRTSPDAFGVTVQCWKPPWKV